MASITRQLIDDHYERMSLLSPSPSPPPEPPRQPLSISETYRLIQNFYPRKAGGQYFLQDAPDVIPLTIPPTSNTDKDATNAILSWTPYTTVQKTSARTYLLGMILHRGHPSGYAFCINIFQQGGKRPILFKYVGTHVGLRKLDCLGAGWNGNGKVQEGMGLRFVFGKEQGSRQNVVFDSTVSELIGIFEEWEMKRNGERPGGTEASWKTQSVPGEFVQQEEAGVEEEKEKVDGEGDWSFLVSPRKTPTKSTTASSPVSPAFTPISEIEDTKAWFRSIRKELNPNADTLPSSPISFNSRSRIRSDRVLPKIVSDTDAAMKELAENYVFGADDKEENEAMAGIIHGKLNLSLRNPVIIALLLTLLPTIFILGFSTGRYVEKVFASWSEETVYAGGGWSEEWTGGKDCNESWIEWLGCYNLVMGW